jgi:hypothetical protein
MDQTPILSWRLCERRGSGEERMAADVLVGGAYALRRLAGLPTKGCPGPCPA